MSENCSIEVAMVRENLFGIPEFSLLPGITVEWYRPGMEEEWFSIQTEANLGTGVNPETFIDEFQSDIIGLCSRQCFPREANGKKVGTCTAWYGNWKNQNYGRMHWLAIIPRLQGLGLGQSLLAMVCRRLYELGHDRAYLTTSANRVPAINLHLKFGFILKIGSSEDANA